MKTKICVFSFENKHLGMLLVLCMLMNGFVPRFNLEVKNYKAACHLAAESAALLTQLFDLPNLSLKIANDLLKKSHKAAKLPDNRQKNGTNTSSDYSIVSFDKKLSAVRYSASVFGGKLAPNAWIYANMPKFTGKLEYHYPAILYLFCLFLMLFSLLPRANIKEESASLLTAKFNIDPVPQLRDWIFYFLNTL